MGINFEYARQTVDFANNLKECIDNFMRDKVYGKNCICKLASIPVGILKALITTVAQIIHIVEPLFKGLANILIIAPFKGIDTFKMGLRQLKQIPSHFSHLITILPRFLYDDLIDNPLRTMRGQN